MSFDPTGGRGFANIQSSPESLSGATDGDLVAPASAKPELTTDELLLSIRARLGVMVFLLAAPWVLIGTLLVLGAFSAATLSRGM